MVCELCSGRHETRHCLTGHRHIVEINTNDVTPLERLPRRVPADVHHRIYVKETEASLPAEFEPPSTFLPTRKSPAFR